MKTIIIPAKQARIKFGELLERAQWGNVQFLITKKAKPVASISGLQEGKLEKKVKPRKRFPFKSYNLGSSKTPLTRKRMYYNERLDRTLGY